MNPGNAFLRQIIALIGFLSIQHTNMLTVLKYIALVGTFFIYTTSGVFSKLASQREFLSPGYIAFLACTVGVLGIYAVLWQQIIKRMDVSLAYIFKGTGVVFGLLLAHFVFSEAITTTNMVGAAIIYS